LAYLLALPVLIVITILQTSIISRLPILQGTADLMMLTLIAWALQEKVKNAWVWTVIGGLFISLVSAMPLPVILTGYLIITGVARIFRRQVWQAPILALFLTILGGTILMNGLYILFLRFSGSPIPLLDSLTLVVLPGILLNILLAIPVQAIVSSLVDWIYPVEIES
jgi:rod shape-determining protein MreD